MLPVACLRGAYLCYYLSFSCDARTNSICARRSTSVLFSYEMRQYTNSNFVIVRRCCVWTASCCDGWFTTVVPGFRVLNRIIYDEFMFVCITQHASMSTAEFEA